MPCSRHTAPGCRCTATLEPVAHAIRRATRTRRASLDAPGHRQVLGTQRLWTLARCLRPSDAIGTVDWWRRPIDGDTVACAMDVVPVAQVLRPLPCSVRERVQQTKRVPITRHGQVGSRRLNVARGIAVLPRPSVGTRIRRINRADMSSGEQRPCIGRKASGLSLSALARADESRARPRHRDDHEAERGSWILTA
jgi:hypothetical protein